MTEHTHTVTRLSRFFRVMAEPMLKLESTLTGVPVSVLRGIRNYPKRKTLIYTPADGKLLCSYLRLQGYVTATLIGSLGRGKNSEHDIDVLLPDEMLSDELIAKLKYLLHCNGEITRTDWGGVYFADTFLGDVDIFFTTKDFSY